MITTEEKIKDEVKQVAQVEQEKQLKHIGQIRPHKGHKLFEVDQKTGVVREAEYEKTDIHYSQDLNKAKRSNKVVVKEGCFYLTALNLNNACRKYLKMVLKHKGTWRAEENQGNDL
jgi:hypothetical protein